MATTEVIHEKEENSANDIAKTLGIVVHRRRSGETGKNGRRPQTFTKSVLSRAVSYRKKKLYEKQTMRGFTNKAGARWAGWPQYPADKVVCHACLYEFKPGDKYMPGSRSAQVLAKFYCMTCAGKRY